MEGAHPSGKFSLSSWIFLLFYPPDTWYSKNTTYLERSILMEIKDYATGLQHIGIPTKDMEKTLEFYYALGFENILSTVNEATGQNVNFLKLGNVVMETYDEQTAAMCYGGIEHVAIDVTDIQAVYDLVCAKGLNTLNDQINFLPFWENGVKFFTIEGPNKEKVEFSQFL